MKELFVIALVLSLLLYAQAALADIYVTGKPLSNDEEDSRYSQLPPYLRYPNDALSAFIFKDKMKEVVNEACNYKFMLYTDIADETPDFIETPPSFEIDETHYYYKHGSETTAWYAVSIMKTESVRTSPLRSWVERADYTLFNLNGSDLALRVPPHMRGKTYRNVKIYDLEEDKLYTELHGFDETHAYCRVFYLDDQLWKKFILVANKDVWAWRIEVNIQSRNEEVIPPDFVPPGQTFGKFYPVN